jgi:hypothetical protein
MAASGRRDGLMDEEFGRTGHSRRGVSQRGVRATREPASGGWAWERQFPGAFRSCVGRLQVGEHR